MVVESATRLRRAVEGEVSGNTPDSKTGQTAVSDDTLFEARSDVTEVVAGSGGNSSVSGEPWKSDREPETDPVPYSSRRLANRVDARRDYQRDGLSVADYFGGRGDTLSRDEIVKTFLGSNGDAAKTGSIAAVIDAGRAGNPASEQVVLNSQPQLPAEEVQLPGPAASRIAVAGVGQSVPENQHGLTRTEPTIPAADPAAPQHERVDVTIIRPRKSIVEQNDEVIGRCRTEKGFAIVLVKACHVGAYWWVQQSVPRQTGYFRARTQFGNDDTPGGSRFRVVVAFVPDGMEIPDAGTQYRELPLALKLSQNLEFTLQRD